MPTGYTQAIYEGKEISFHDLVMGASRAFGATILLRDEGPGVLPTPENVREQSTYYEEMVENQKAQLLKFGSMSADEVLKRCMAENDEAMISWTERVRSAEELKARYEGWIERVEAWEAPETHQTFKEFILDQLRESLKFDYNLPPVPTPVDPATWLEEKLSSARRNIEHYTEEIRKRNERNDERSEWVRALLDSLPASTEEVVTTT